MDRRIVITGGAGFIGGALIDRLLARGEAEIVCLDKLTYAGNRFRLEDQVARGLTFHQIDLADQKTVHEALVAIRPELVYHLAAESHVDRSIDGPDPFIATNVLGTANLLAACLEVQETRKADDAQPFRLVHVSTDEVFGSADPGEQFSESSPYRPQSPYSATKAAADHLVAAWRHTFGLRAIITNCSNNYGPYQFPEKLIPHTIIRALTDQEIPIYGDGQNERDWIHVDDHVEGLLLIASQGTPEASYLLGARNVISNVDLVLRLCGILDEVAPASFSHANRIRFVPDRPGHDRRYALDPVKTEANLAWRAKTPFDQGLRETVEWYIENQAWWHDLMRSGYKADRLGLLA